MRVFTVDTDGGVADQGEVLPGTVVCANGAKEVTFIATFKEETLVVQSFGRWSITTQTLGQDTVEFGRGE